MSERLLWLWLSLVVGTGSSASDLLLERYDYDIEKIYDAMGEDIADIAGGADIAQRLDQKSLDQAQELSAYCQQNAIGIAYPTDPLYPKRLRSINSRPVLLYYKGKLKPLDDELCVAMVGTRSMTQYGAQSAYSFAYEMARAGAVIVSGMARGVDSISARGALDAGGYTIAVLGCGADKVYPAENEALYREIAANGAVISEFRPLTPPYGHNFPMRNRIISGFSQATLVVEAGERSGALITARTALTQGRSLYALPGKVGESTSEGTNKLIRAGAGLALYPIDILSEFVALYPRKINLARLMPYARRVVVPELERARRSAEKQKERKAANSIGFEGEETVSIPYSAPESESNQKMPLPDAQTILNQKLPDAQTVLNPPAYDGAPEKRGQDRRSQSDDDEKRRADAAPVHDFTELDDIERAIYAALKPDTPNNPDELAAKFGGASRVLSKLTMLEIKGYVKIAPGGYYLKI
ncbi:MAG: DNA-processing protein DprA [Eubacteriales bacterium]